MLTLGGIKDVDENCTIRQSSILSFQQQAFQVKEYSPQQDMFATKGELVYPAIMLV
jgi:hypothetical protein